MGGFLFHPVVTDMTCNVLEVKGQQLVRMVEWVTILRWSAGVSSVFNN